MNVGQLESRFDNVYSRIKQACVEAGRDLNDVTLVAVSKKQPAEKIQKYIDYCAKIGRPAVLGENYVQEWCDKQAALTGEYTCHLIGHLQSNKVKQAVKVFDSIQTVDSLKIIQALEKEAVTADKKFSAWIQVNISDDQAKYGISAAQVEPLVEALLGSALEFSGLMTITKLYDDPSDAKGDFEALASVAGQLRQHFGLATVALSMGMSEDFEYAIAAGATHIRVGTALFGER